jgi:hypothetical protein
MRLNILMPIMNFMTKFYHSFIIYLRSFSEHISKTFFLALFTGILLFAYSCEEDPSIVGRKLLPSSDFVFIKSTDTINVESYTLYSNSYETDNPSVSYLGDLYDPYFGSTTAEFVSQLRLGSEWDKKPFVVDSVKLFLRLLSVKGNVDDMHYLRLSQISQQIYTDSAYYSNQTVPLTGYVVDSILLPTLQADTINDIVLNLPVSFGDSLTSVDSMLSYTPGHDFRSFFKGLYFQLFSPNDPLFVSLSVAPSSTYGYYNNYFVLYMHDEFSTSKTFVFILDAYTKNAAYNRYIHNFEDGEVGKRMQHLIDNDTNYKDTVSYVQTMNGAYTKIKIPELETVRENPDMKNISVNKARLVIPVYYDGDLYKPSTIPSIVFLRYVTSGGSKYLVPDYSISSAFYDGSPDTTATINVYNLNIPAFLQDYFEDTSDKIKPELEIFLTSSSSNNVILKANNSHTPVKLEFTYTKF